MMLLNLLKIEELLSQQLKLELLKQPTWAYSFHAEIPICNKWGPLGAAYKGLSQSPLKQFSPAI